MKQKILVLDIDGTLTNTQKDITPATKQAIRTILAKGHKVILASGRPTPGVRYEKELELGKYGGYILSFNGAKVEECRAGEIVYQRILPGSIVSKIYDFAETHNCGLMTYRDGDIISAFEPDEYVLLESSMVSFAGVGVTMGNAQPALKAVADYITDTNDNDGLLQVINKFILNA